MDHLVTVTSIYEAFGRGDVPAVLATLADDVRWEEWADNQGQKSGVPWLRARHGKAGAMEFLGVAGQLTIHDFRVLSLMAGGSQVAAEIVIDATTPSGVRYRDEELHRGPLMQPAKSCVCGTTSTRRSTSPRRRSDSSLDEHHGGVHGGA